MFEPCYVDIFLVHQSCVFLLQYLLLNIILTFLGSSIDYFAMYHCDFGDLEVWAIWTQPPRPLLESDFVSASSVSFFHLLIIMHVSLLWTRHTFSTWKQQQTRQMCGCFPYRTSSLLWNSNKPSKYLESRANSVKITAKIENVREAGIPAVGWAVKDLPQRWAVSHVLKEEEGQPWGEYLVPCSNLFHPPSPHSHCWSLPANARDTCLLNY